MNPDMRLVVMLREPVARAHSSFQYMRARGFEPLEDFLEAVAPSTQRKRDNWHHLWHYTRMSLYADAIEAMIDAVGPRADQRLVLRRPGARLRRHRLRRCSASSVHPSSRARPPGCRG